MNNTILEYLEGYFGNELNESTSDEDIMEAFNELLETADAVEEFMIQEGPMSMLKKIASVRTGIRDKRDLKMLRRQRNDSKRGDRYHSDRSRARALAKILGRAR